MSCPPPLHPPPAEIERLLALLSSPNSPTATSAATSLSHLLDAYLSLPSLLDPLLPTLLPPLLSLSLSRLTPYLTPPGPALPLLPPFSVLYTVAKVRGLKPLAAHFPHQVSDLHRLSRLVPLVETTPHLRRLWHVRYVLYAWLAVAIRLPFPLHTVLPTPDLDALVHHAHSALAEPGPVASVAVAFLARLLARRDGGEYRRRMLEWACGEGMERGVDGEGGRVPSLMLLAATLKLARRDDVSGNVLRIVEALCGVVGEGIEGTREAHLVCKSAARAALVVLPRLVAPWRYTKTGRVVFAREGGLARRQGAVGNGVGHVGKVEVGEEAGEVGEEGEEVLESVVEVLLEGLQHVDTVVRWSAAKGVGRVTGRLPLLMAQDVVDSVLELFAYASEARADAAWHGGCLAVAELARRGLLLPGEAQFEMAWEVVGRAARFDVRRGANSVGAHVRDAACYAVWAMARAYGKEEVAPFAGVVVESMLPVALLDREVNCRRAAAAALQECVGRLSEELFEEGIRLVTVADYFGLGDRTAAYLSVAPKVAALGGGGYFECIVHELATRKLAHWDAGIRVLAAKALAKMIKLDREGVILEKIVPDLVRLSTQKGDMVVRHGAVLGLAEVVRIAGGVRLGERAVEIRSIPKELTKRTLIVGRTGDEMRLACSQLVESLAIAAGKVYLEGPNSRADAEHALDFLEGILGCGKEDMYSNATSAYGALCNMVIAKDEDWHAQVTRRILRGISQEGLFERQRGFALAAGVCGDSGISKEVVDVLCHELLHNKDVEVRRNAAKSLGRLPNRVIRARTVPILNALALAMHDYATDERGDVGSWVREASMQAASSVAKYADGLDEVHPRASLISEADETLLGVLRGIVQQCCGRIDRTRAVAGSSLVVLCELFAFDDRSTNLSSLFIRVADCFHISKQTTESNSGCGVRSTLNFQDTETVFPAVRRALGVKEIADAVVTGFISAGGGFGHQSRAALESLVAHFAETTDVKTSRDHLRSIVRIVADKNERLVIPAFTVLQELAKRGALHQFESIELIEIARVVRASWRQKLRDVRRTTAAVHLLGELAELSMQGPCFDFREGSLGRECLEAIVVVLGGSIPRLRRIAMECIYISLIEYACEDGETLDKENWSLNSCSGIAEALHVLLDTEWEQLSTLVARERRNLLCKLLQIKAPSPSKPAIAPR